jgi:hypothetical protein
MKKTILLIVIAVLSLVGCEKAYTDREYTLEELDYDRMIFRPYESFKDVFPDVASQYKLSTEENIAIGKWGRLRQEAANSVHILYPNRLYIGRLIKTMKGTTDEWLGYSIGTWDLQGEGVTVIIKGFIYVKRIAERNRTYKYRSCTPYNVELFSVSDIDPIGYSKKSFTLVPLPRDVAQTLVRDKNSGNKSQYRKEFYSIHLIGDPRGRVTNDYSFFKHVEEMAAKGITGAMIVDDPVLREKYVLELLKSLQ